MKYVETGQRGYVLTGDESYLAPYEDAIRDVANELADPSAYLLRDSALHPSFLQLEWRSEKVRRTEGSDTTPTRRGLEGAIQYIAGGRGKDIMDRIRDLCSSTGNDPSA